MKFRPKVITPGIGETTGLAGQIQNAQEKVPYGNRATPLTNMPFHFAENCLIVT